MDWVEMGRNHGEFPDLFKQLENYGNEISDIKI
jgi:hypothetical protein